METEYQRFKNVTLGLLGIIWAFPICLFTWLFALILYATGQVEKSFQGPYLTFIIDLKNDGKFCEKYMTAKGWVGFGWGNIVFLKDVEKLRWGRTLKHELTHIYQQYVFGALMPILYILASIFIWLFIRSKHSYYDNPFERHARKRAGQMVNIPKSMWGPNPKDRWAWW